MKCSEYYIFFIGGELELYIEFFCLVFLVLLSCVVNIFSFIDKEVRLRDVKRSVKIIYTV